MLPRIDPKTPNEIISVSADFAKLTAAINGATWSMSVFEGIDAGIGTMLYGTSTESGAVSAILVRNGVNGCIYKIKFLATTADGTVYESAALLPVLEK